MRHRERFVKQSRLRLPDGTRLGAKFSQLVLAALDHAGWHKRLPPLRRGYVRFRASNTLLGVWANAEGRGVRLRADCYRRYSLSSRLLSAARLSGQGFSRNQLTGVAGL